MTTINRSVFERDIVNEVLDAVVVLCGELRAMPEKNVHDAIARAAAKINVRHIEPVHNSDNPRVVITITPAAIPEKEKGT